MIVQFSPAVRNARADAVEAEIGASPTIKIFGDDGSMPANTAGADSGTILATVPLPADWMDDSVAGVIAKLGTWQDAAADASGTALYWRLYRSGGACDAQGDISNQAGSGSMKLTDTALTSGLPFTVVSFGWTEGNA